MYQGTILDLLIRLETLKRIFVFCQEIDFLPRGKPIVLGKKCPNLTKFLSRHFLLLYVPRVLGVS